MNRSPAVRFSSINSKTAHTGNLLLPAALSVSIEFSDLLVNRYFYSLKVLDKGNCKTVHVSFHGTEPVTGGYVIYIPSIAGILLYDILASVPDARGLILDKAWGASGVFLLKLTCWLQYERLRLGSDVESLYLRKLVFRERMQQVLPRLTIGQWIDMIDRTRRFSLPAHDFVFWRGSSYRVQGEDINRWFSRYSGNSK